MLLQVLIKVRWVNKIFAAMILMTMFLSVDLTQVLASITHPHSGYLEVVVRTVSIMEQRQSPG